MGSKRTTVRQPLRHSTRHAKQAINLKAFLTPRERARGVRRYKPSNTSGGVQAGTAASPVVVEDVGVSPGNAADSAAANLPVLQPGPRVRATATATTDAPAGDSLKYGYTDTPTPSMYRKPSRL